jgi:purine-binding chemotaxis protein CheW
VSATSLEALRRAFDAEFAAAPVPRAEHVDVIALRAGGASLAVRVTDVAGVVPFRAIAPLPCDEPALLGVAAVRGVPLPVYDLAALMGREASRATRWMLLAGGTHRVALAFEEIEEYLSVPRGSLAAAAPASSTACAPSHLLRDGSSPRSLFSVAELLRQLEERLAARTKGR